MIFSGDEVALGGDAAFGVSAAVWLPHVDGARLVVEPNGFTCGGVERMDVNAVAGPDSGGEVDDVIADDGAAADRPGGGQMSVAEDRAVVGAAASFQINVPVFALRQ